MKNKKYLLSLPLIVALYFVFPSTEKISPSKDLIIARSPSSLKSTDQEYQKSEVTKTSHPQERKFKERNLAGTLAVYKKMQRFPSTTQPFSQGSKIDPIAQRIAPKANRRLGESDKFYEIETTLEKNLINQDDQSIKFSVHTYSRGKKIDAQKIIIMGKNFTQEMDRNALGEYLIELPVSSWEAGSYSFQVVAEFEDEKLDDEIHLEKSLSLAKHLQSFSPEISSQGDLVFRNEFEFKVSGEMLIEATLYSSAGELLGKAHQVLNVEKGIKPVEISFYGLLLHDLKFSGSVEVKHLQVSLVDENLETKALEVHTLNQKSAELHWDQFRSTPFNHPLIQEKIARLEK